MNGRPALLLASASPRRADLLRTLGLTFAIEPADVDETASEGEAPHDHVARLAVAKAAAVGCTGDLVIAADTVVVLDEQILGKPADADDARATLARLSGRAHEVLTGIAVSLVGDGGERRTVDTVVSTYVWFAELDEGDLDWYVASGEPLDKAGSYGIQGIGGLFVEAIQGSYHNVVGLPLAELDQLLDELGFSLRDFTA